MGINAVELYIQTGSSGKFYVYFMTIKKKIPVSSFKKKRYFKVQPPSPTQSFGK